MNDEEIIKEVGEWQRMQEASKKEKRHLIKLFFKGFGLLVFVLAIGFGIVATIPYCHKHNQKKAEDARQQHMLYEDAWLSCVESLGLNKCELIEARVATRCLEDQGQASTISCLKKEISQTK